MPGPSSSAGWKPRRSTSPCRAKRRTAGTLHPLTLVLGEVRDIFTTMGFEVMEGPEIELDHINFEMLNIPKDHPGARHAGYLLHQ